MIVKCSVLWLSVVGIFVTHDLGKELLTLADEAFGLTKDIRYRPPVPATYGAFPNDKHSPLVGLQCSQHFTVSFDVTGDLGFPERRMRLGPSEQWAIVTVPKAPMNKNNGAVSGED